MSNVRYLLEQAAERHRASDLPAAQHLYRRVLELDGDQATALAALGTIAGHNGHAAQAREHLARACLLEPGNAVFHHNHGESLRKLGQLPQAEAALRRAAELDRGLVPAYLGNTLIEQARFDEAEPCYEGALLLQPDFPQAEHNRGSGSLFNRLYVPTLDYPQIAALHRDWGVTRSVPKGRHWSNTRQPDRVLRVGYFSPDFREHAMRHFIEPLLACHDASRVELVCYAQGPTGDAFTRKLIAYGHRWNWVHGLDDQALATQIERDAIDILVDCAGHTQGTRIVAMQGKPAPLMMSWLGYLCTSGLPAMDYRLTAMGLAQQPELLAQTRRDLRDRMQASTLCNEAGFVRRLEDVYRVAWQHWLQTA